MSIFAELNVEMKVVNAVETLVECGTDGELRIGEEMIVSAVGECACVHACVCISSDAVGGRPPRYAPAPTFPRGRLAPCAAEQTAT